MWRGLKWCFWNESVCFQSAFGPLNSSCLSDAGQGIDDIFPFLSKWTNHTYGFLPLPLAVPVQRLWNAFEACNYSGEPTEARNGTAKGRECLLAAIRCPARCWPCGLQWWDQHRAHTDWQEPGCAEQLRNCHSCWMEQNMIFNLALCSISLWSGCLFSFACKIHARLWQERKGKVLVTGCDCRTLSDGHSFYSL